MAEDTIGFDVESGISETPWANLAQHLGSIFPTVNNVNTNKVTQGATSMTVDVASGISSAFGVRHNITSVINKPIAPVTLSGAVRWDAVCKRWDWSTNGQTIEVVPGAPAVGAAMVNPAGLYTTPGEKFDQVLALVKATNGSNALDIRDRRAWASKFYTVATTEALPPTSLATYGAVCYVVDIKTIFRCLISGGSLAWISDAPALTEITGAAVLAPGTDFAVDGTHVNRCLIGPNWRQIDLELRYKGTELNANNDNGNIGDTPIAVLTAACLPDRPMPVDVRYESSSGAVYGGVAVLDPTDGTLMLLQLAPMVNLPKQTAIGKVSVRASIFFGRKAA